MEPSELVAFITSIAVFVAKNVPDDDKLGLLAATFTQLGDTLATIAVQRQLLEKKTPPAAEQATPEKKS